MTEPLTFTYRYKAGRLFLCIFFFGLCAAMLGHEALNNGKGLVINNIIELDAGNATIFYWVLAALSLGFVLLGLIGFMAQLTADDDAQVLTLGEKTMTLPQGAFRKVPRELAYADITAMKQQEVQGQRFLTVKLANGKKVSLAAVALPKKEDFDTVCSHIAARLDAAKLQR